MNLTERKENYNFFDKKVIDIINKVIDVISGMFLPLVNVMSASGILKGILAILVTFDVLSETSSTYVILHSISDGFFYFVPVFLAYTASKKFNTDSFTSILIAMILVHPSITQLFQSDKIIDFMGFRVIPAIYSSSVIPIILAIGMLHFVEKIISKVLPEVIEGFFTPLCSILIIIPLTILLFGPIGIKVGDFLANVYSMAYNFSPTIAGFFIGSLIQVMVIFGFHWSLVPLAINNIAVNGYDTILALMGAAAFAQAGAALAVCIKTKNKKLKTISLSAAISALFGVTEPALFGVNLPLKKPLIFVCIGGGVGGAIAGATGAAATSFAFPGLATLPVYLGKGFSGFLISCIVGFLLSFLLTFIFKFEDKKEELDIKN